MPPMSEYRFPANPKPQKLQDFAEQARKAYLHKILNSPPTSLDLYACTDEPVGAQRRLKTALNRLTEGTEILPVPRYGAIAVRKVIMRTSWAPAYSHPKPFDPFGDWDLSPPSSPGSFYNISMDAKTRRTVTTKTDIVAPVPIVPIGSARACFEVKAYASTLRPVMADFAASFAPISARSSDGMFYDDENTAPIFPFLDEDDEDEENPKAVAIPAPHLRGKREPFGVLHATDKDNSIPALHAPGERKQIGVALFNKVYAPSQKPTTFRDTEYAPFPVLYETGSKVEMRGAKGWARLHAKAPAPINMDAVHKADVWLRANDTAQAIAEQGYGETPSVPCFTLNISPGKRVLNAPMIASVPLPVLTPPIKCDSVEAERFAIIRALRPAQPVLTLPLSPNRMSLLSILHGG